MEREVLLHVQPVGENEHEGNAEFVIVQSFQLFFVNFHGEFPALFSKAPGEGNGDRKSTRLNSSHQPQSRMPSSA